MPESLADLKFWLVALAIVVVMTVVRTPRTAWFGALNLGVLGFWLGWRVAAAAAAFSLALWTVLWFARRRRHPAQLARSPTIAVAALLVALFSLHKLNLEYASWLRPVWDATPGRVGATLLGLIGALSFSYVVLRAYDMAAGVLLSGTKLLGPLAAAGYLFPFHMLLSGPISAYREHAAADDAGPTSEPRRQVWLRAVNDITTGMLYKYVISEYMRIFAFGASGAICVESVLDMSYLFVYIFFDFAGYSRIALGLGRLLGIPTPENFRAPFSAKTLTEFFTRWHMSLGKFIQRNIYNPLQLHLVRRWGVKRAVLAGILSLLAGWLAVGLWHRFSLAFLCYGLAMSLWLWAEKMMRDRLLRRPWSRRPWAQWVSAVFGPVYVFATLTVMLYSISQELIRP